MAKKLEELPVHSKAMEFSVAVTALLGRPAFGKNRNLRDQIENANDSILSNMSEGFEQPTDRAVMKYLFDAKGSAAEVVTRLATAQRKGYVTLDEFRRCRTIGEEVQRMLGGWIKYLAQCDWKDRGRHGIADP
jgi:four helix bundle protein